MPGPVTDNDVKKARDRVDQLREQIEAERLRYEQNQKAGENAHTTAVLGDEADRLQAELAALKELNKTTTTTPTPPPDAGASATVPESTAPAGSNAGSGSGLTDTPTP